MTTACKRGYISDGWPTALSIERLGHKLARPCLTLLVCKE